MRIAILATIWLPALALSSQMPNPMPTPTPMPTATPGLSIPHSNSVAADTAALLALMEALRTDEDAQVRRSAAWALGEMEDALAVPALGEALQGDASQEVRLTAAWAMGEIESTTAIRSSRS